MFGSKFSNAFFCILRFAEVSLVLFWYMWSVSCFRRRIEDLYLYFSEIPARQADVITQVSVHTGHLVPPA